MWINPQQKIVPIEMHCFLCWKIKNALVRTEAGFDLCDLLTEGNAEFTSQNLKRLTADELFNFT